MSNKSPSLATATAAEAVTPSQHRSHRSHPRQHPEPATSAPFTIVQLTDALLPLLETVEAASYPASYCEGVAGYAKRLHAKPPCPSFVCLQCTSANGVGVTRDVAELAAAGAVDHLRAIGYAVTCRMPRRTASLLLRDELDDDDDMTDPNSPRKKKAMVMETNGGGLRDTHARNGSGGVADNHAVRPLLESNDHLELQPQHVPADTFYVHDVAVHPDFRGLGVAGALWRKIEEARVQLRLKRMSLVAVFGASTYWARHGFREVARKELPVDTVRVLDDYGDHAVFMERED